MRSEWIVVLLLLSGCLAEEISIFDLPSLAGARSVIVGALGSGEQRTAYASDLDDQGKPSAPIRFALEREGEIDLFALAYSCPLETLGLEGFLKTTGGKGLHVVVPIAPTRDWVQAKAFCKAVADLLVRTFPDRFTSNLKKSTRTGRIFVDYLRNAENATAIAPYSLRAKAHAPVAMPIGWDQLKEDLRFAHFNVNNVPALVRKRRRDPWAALPGVRQELTDAMLRQMGVA